jgi:hypothetical protein
MRPREDFRAAQHGAERCGQGLSAGARPGLLRKLNRFALCGSQAMLFLHARIALG